MIALHSPAICLQVQRPRSGFAPQVPGTRRQHEYRTLCNASVAIDPPHLSANESRHTLPGGMQLEVLRCAPESQAKHAPLLFLHGSGHGAWCWDQKFSPHFAQQGRDCWAISFRGQGTGSSPEKGAAPGTLVSNAADLAHFAATLPEPPVMVCHSFGGLILQKYLQTMEAEGWPRPAGVAFLAAGPPSGSGELVKRMFKSSPLRSLRITWGFITKSYLRSASATRFLFFSDKLPEDELHRYHQHLVSHPGCSLVDVSKVNAEMPIRLPPHSELPPTFVAGASSDIIVDVQAVQELAEALGTNARVFEGGHDMMLDTHWKDIADSLEEWLTTIDNC